MQQSIFESLSQLLSGQPKQATATLQMLMNTTQNFFSTLTKIIIQQPSKNNQKNNQIQKVAIVILNTLAIRCKLNGELKDYLKLQEIYQCLKKVLVCQYIVFENKKFITPALSQYFKDALSTHKQILQLKSQLSLSENKQTTLILLDAIVKSTEMHKPIQIQCILQLFQLAVGQAINCLTIISSWSHPERPSLKKLTYFINLLSQLFTKIFKQLNQPFEYQAMTLLSQNAQLARLQFDLLSWRNPQDQKNKYCYPWLQDFISTDKEQRDDSIEFFDINNLKEKVFIVISSIIEKTNPNFNLVNSQHHLISHLPALCSNVLHQIQLISNQFSSLNKDYVIGSLYDSMLYFLSQCLNLNDLHQIFNQQLSLHEFISHIIQFIKIRDTDIKSMDDEQFTNFLQGFVGQINIDCITRYGVSKLVKACCKKIDMFPALFFSICFNGVIDKIRERLIINRFDNYSEDSYQHLYIDLQQKRQINSHNSITQNTDLSTYLLCLVTIQLQISQRTDFQHHLIKLFTTINYHHLQKQQLTLVYFILSKHTYLFLNIAMLEFLPNILSLICQIMGKDQPDNTKTNGDTSTCIISMQFLKQLYLHTITPTPITHPLSQQLLTLVFKTIWQLFIKMSQSNQPTTNSIDDDKYEYFYDLVLDVVHVDYVIDNYEKKNGWYGKEEGKGNQQFQAIVHHGASSKIQKIRVKYNIQTIGDYLLTQISTFINILLQNLCKNFQITIIQPDHNNLIALRLYQCIAQCIQSLDIMNSMESNNRNIKIVEYRQYAHSISAMIQSIMKEESAGESGSISTEELLNMVELLAILINQERMRPSFTKLSQSVIPQSLFQCLLPVMLEHTFGESWLTCICEFVHRIQGKFQINQIYKITQMIKQGYQKYIDDQRKINELSLFAIVLLNYHQPENWLQIHEIVRIILIKYIKIENQSNRKEKQKKMIKYGFESQKVFQITAIRLFHVYLFGFKMQNHQELLTEILQQYGCFIQKYCLIEATHLIIGLKSSYPFINETNLQKLLDILLLILNKLVLNSNFYGNQSIEQSQIRQLSQKIAFMTIDPFVQFRKFVDQLLRQGNNLIQHPKHGQLVKDIMNVSTFMGQPRKIYSIAKKNRNFAI